MSPAKEIAELREKIRHHDYLYFVEGRTEVSDLEYDRLFARLKELEAAHPELITPDSPTQRVGGEPLEGFAHVRHALPMMSIDNTYSAEEVREFDRRVAKGLEGRPYEYVVEPKVDGVSASLRYEGGRLVMAATRGDGRTGDDITANIRTIRAVPLGLRDRGWPEVLEARGEVYWPRKAFDAYNERRKKEGEEPFANPRNATTGTLKSLDSRAIADRRLAFVTHGAGEIVGREFKTGEEMFKAFRGWGLPVNPHHRVCKEIESVIAFIEEWEPRRHELEYETDGLVIKVNRIDQREILGVTSRYPRWCIAYKYAAEQAESKLLAVDFQVGKLGTITPRAVMEPMQLSGTIVRHASLHNFDQVERLGEGHDGLRIGDTVLVEKAGEIIPQVLKITREGKPRGARIKPPTKCPVCKGEVAKDEGGVYIRCINPACEAQLKERLRYFCGRDQMNIKGAGEAIIDRLVDIGWVHDFADLYRLKDRRDELARLELLPKQLGAKKIDELLKGIKKVQEQPLLQVLSKLRFIQLDEDSIKCLSRRFRSIMELANAEDDEIGKVESLNPLAVPNLHYWFFPKTPQLRKERFTKLVGPTGLRFKGAGAVLIEKLVDEGIVQKFADFFLLNQRRDRLMALEFKNTFGEKSAEGLLKQIEASKKQSLPRVLAALNIPQVGTATAEMIVDYDHFNEMENIANASLESLQEIDGIGPEVAASIRRFFDSKSGQESWRALQGVGVKVSQPKRQLSSHQPLAGKTVVVTGTLKEFSRSEIEKLIKDLGGKTTGSVSKKTDFLISGEDAGSKLDKARELGIKVLQEHDFLNMIGDSGNQ